MIIDFHGHYFPDELAPRAVEQVTAISAGHITPSLDGTIASLRTEMSRLKIESTVTLPVATREEQVITINRNLPLSTKGITPFGALHPAMELAPDEVSYLKKVGVMGVKLHPEYQDFYLDDPQWNDFFSLLESSSLIVLIHAGFDPGPFSSDHATPERISKLLAKHPQLKLVAAHLGGLLQWDAVETHLCGTNCHLDTSAIAGRIKPKQFKRICESHGYEKILFGSDSPWEPIDKAIDFVRQSNLTQEAQEAILYRNAQNLLS